MTRSVRARLGSALIALVLISPAVAARPAPAAAATSNFPVGWQGYHTYAEMVSDLNATVVAHPTIAKAYSLGTSYQGRTIWAVKISDNVTVDENEPEVLFDGLTHSDEHMGLEMTLHIMHWLVDGYGVDPRITTLVNARVVWIILAVNPDGAEYDISGGRFHFWRKNRQPTPGTSYIGTDLNRNYGYRWGIAEGRTSTNPAAITYMGPSAFSAPETRVVRDFLASRVINGRQRIRAAITFHESGRLVMWPYGYTYTDVPPDMTLDDHNALVKIGRYMASTNGYKPEQASDLYLTSGTTRDYEYGVYRIFSYTFEMSVVDYPKDTLIASETGRNKEAVLYLIDRAWCPLGVLGDVVKQQRCGAFDDDLEVRRGWQVNANGTDTATAGRWEWGDPYPTATAAGPKQVDRAYSGRYGWFTGILAGRHPGSNDVDGGTTSVTSPPIQVPTTAGQRLEFRWVFADDLASVTGDELRTQVIDVGTGAATNVLVKHGGLTAEWNASWHLASIDMTAFRGRTVRIRFSATDAGTESLVEAGFDDVRITRGT